MRKTHKTLVPSITNSLCWAFIAVALTGGRLTAQTVYHACYVPTTGILYIVEVEGACRNDRHVPISWTEGVVGWLHNNLNGLDVGDPHTQYLLKSDAPDGHSLDAADGTPTNVLNVDNDGRVGIGTAYPTSDLHIVGNRNGSVGLVIENQSSDPYSAERITFRSPDGYDNVLIQVDDPASASHGAMTIANNRPDGSIRFNTGSAPKLVVANDGNVGIGTISPQEKLTVAGSVKITSGGLIFPNGSVQTEAADGGSGGLSGYEHVQTAVVPPGALGSGSAIVALAQCSVGKMVLSGGHRVTGTTADLANLMVRSSKPGPTNPLTSWEVQVLWLGTAGPGPELEVSAYAICVDAG